jgi:beta,beta-carotene 9',10'-dioxygenase
MTKLSAPASTGAYVSGFTSLDAEIEVDDLPVHGTIPDWLRGTLTRNGPAHYEAGSKSFRHWFDGQAMLHRFTVASGRVSYRNRFLRTESFRMAREQGRIGFREFATEPCRSTFARFFSILADNAPTPNASVNVVPMNGGYAALTERPIAVQFDPDTLETLGVTGYDDQLDGQVTTAHPHHQPGTNDLINHVLKFGPRSQYRIYRQRPDSMTRQLVAAVPTQRPGYLHSFAITEHYAVLAVFPLVVNPPSLLLRGKPFIENYRWRPELGTQFIDAFSLERLRNPGTYPSEPVFIPAPKPDSEDDGVILSVVLDTTQHRSFLLVLDAATFTELARAEIPHAIPFGFHGHFATNRNTTN